MFWIISAEPPGALSLDSKVDYKQEPPIIHDPTFEFDFVPHDDLCDSHPIYIVSLRLKQAIEDSGLSGVQIVPLKQRKSEQYQLLYPEEKVPLYWWLQPTGRACLDDFGTVPRRRLVVSDAALETIRMFNHEYLFCRPYVVST